MLGEVLVVELLRIVDDLPEVVACGNTTGRHWTVCAMPPGGWSWRRVLYFAKVGDVTIAVTHGTVALGALRPVVRPKDELRGF